MTDTEMVPEQILSAVSSEDMPVLDAIFQMHLDTLAMCNLDARSYHLSRLAALVAVEAPPASYLAHVPLSTEAGITLEDVQGMFIAIAPLVGTPKITAAAGNVLRALGLAEALEDS